MCSHPLLSTVEGGMQLKPSSTFVQRRVGVLCSHPTLYSRGNGRMKLTPPLHYFRGGYVEILVLASSLSSNVEGGMRLEPSSTVVERRV